MSRRLENAPGPRKATIRFCRNCWRWFFSEDGHRPISSLAGYLVGFFSAEPFGREVCGFDLCRDLSRDGVGEGIRGGNGKDRGKKSWMWGRPDPSSTKNQEGRTFDVSEGAIDNGGGPSITKVGVGNGKWGRAPSPNTTKLLPTSKTTPPTSARRLCNFSVARKLQPVILHPSPSCHNLSQAVYISADLQGG